MQLSDALILLIYFAGSVAVGLWMGRGQKNATDYLLGGRSIPWWAVLLSIVATETSSVTFLSIPGLAFKAQGGNLQFLQLTIGFMLGRLIVVFLFLPHYFRGDLFTAYEVLDRRFGGATKRTASLMFLITRNLADGLRLYLTAIVFQKFLGLDMVWCIALVGVTTIVYTVFGGMRSVIWSDCLQFLIYVAGAVVAAGVILAALPGGWSEFVEFGRAQGKFQILELELNFARPFTLWSGIVGGVFLTLATHGTDQMMVQRYLAAGSLKLAGRALAASGLVICAQFALFLLIGVGLAAFYQAFPAEVHFTKGDEAFAAFIVDHMPHGVIGLTVAAVLSAAMSTLSGSLNSSAGALVQDWYLPLCRVRPSEAHVLRVSRVWTVVFGLIQIGVGIAGMRLAASVVDSVLSIASFTSGSILGVFFLGVLTRRVTQTAALVGLVVGLSVLTAAAFGTTLAWPWYSVVGSLVTFAVGIGGSWLGLGRATAASETRDHSRRVDNS